MNLKARIKGLLKPMSISTLANDPWVIERAKIIVEIFYYVMIYLAMENFQSWTGLINRQNFVPLWPLWWVNYFSLSFVDIANIIRFLFLGSTIIGAIYFRNRFGRLVVFIGMWQAHALESSFGQPSHQLYMFVWVSLLFVFLPSIWKERKATDEKNKKFLLLLWWSQALLFLTYTMSGLGKFLGTYSQFMAGQINGFSVDAFAYQIANWLPKLQTDAVLGPFIINHPILGWPFYVSVHFLLFFSMWVMVRPSLQRFWAISISLFHIGTFVFMGISFTQPMLLLILLVYASPFIPRDLTWRQMFFDLPVLGQIAEYLAGGSKAGTPSSLSSNSVLK